MVSLSEMKQEKSQARARASLIGLNFFAETDHMGPLVAVYLVEIKNWDVVWFGYVSVIMNIIMVFSQTPAGDLMDKTRHKKFILATSLIIASVTTAAVAWTSELWAVILIKVVEGIAASMSLPGLMALLLAIVPGVDVPKMVSLTEVSNKIGSVLFTIATGFVAHYAYPHVQYIFYLLGAGGMIASAFILAIPSEKINHTRARAGAETKNANSATDSASSGEVDAERMESEEPLNEPSSYKEILSDRKILMFALLTFFYYLSNAAVAPLVAQLIAHEDKRSGLVFASVILCIFYLVQAPTAYIVGLTYERFGYKKLLMVSHLILPIRCVICALLAMYYPNRYALIATQILEGIGAGIYDTMIPLVVGSLVRGSGRFGVTFGFIVTCWRLGHGFSLLIGEAILKAADEHYEVPFFVLGAVGLLTCFVFVFGVSPPPPLESATDEHHPPIHRASSIMYISSRTLGAMK